jgi:hypothetical protein
MSLSGTASAARALQWKEEVHMYPVFSPLQVFVFWLDILMLPWKMMIAPAADSLTEAAASNNPASVAGLDPVSPQEIGTSATDFSTDAKVGHQPRKSNTSRAAAKKAVKKVGNSRKKVKRRVGR